MRTQKLTWIMSFFQVGEGRDKNILNLSKQQQTASMG